MTVSLVAMRCRTSDRTPHAARGVDYVAPRIADRLGIDFRAIGEPSEPVTQDHAADLEASRGCLLEAGGQIGDALDGGATPLLLASECSVALTTLPAVTGHRPDARFLWLDAHGDFNTPQRSDSGYLGGMPLAAACGHFDAGLGAAHVAERSVVLAGVRDLDPEERRALERSEVTVIGASPVETLVAVKNALDGQPVYVHLDLDVIDPESMPAQYPAPDGLRPEKLYDVLEAVAASSELVGAEITCFEAPVDPSTLEQVGDTVLHAIDPLLEALANGAHRAA